MPYVPCAICAKDFYAKPRHIKRGWGKYCSQECKYVAQHNGVVVRCTACGKDVYRTRKDIRKSRSKTFYCDKSCLARWKNLNAPTGEMHFNWKTGRNAYRNVVLRNKVPQKCTDCGMEDKRVLIVHHIDRNRLNNELKNLKWLCRNCHYLEHRGKTV